MIIFPQEYIVRRFSSSVVRGSERITHEDIKVSADIQKDTTAQTVQPEGARITKILKVWSDDRFHINDQITGELSDWIWNDGHWFECTSCQLSKNTLLQHYTSDFELVSEAAASRDSIPPEEVSE